MGDADCFEKSGAAQSVDNENLIPGIFFDEQQAWRIRHQVYAGKRIDHSA